MSKTLQQHGKIQGQKILEKYGPEHFAEMGRKSIAVQKEKYGQDVLSVRGRNGAAARKKKDPRYMEKMRAKRWGKSMKQTALDLLLGK